MKSEKAVRREQALRNHRCVNTAGINPVYPTPADLRSPHQGEQCSGNPVYGSTIRRRRTEGMVSEK